jgi:hypothetical protein
MARSLDQIPFTELSVGMKVVNAHGKKGEISGLYENFPYVDVGLSPCVSLKWDEGQASLYVFHGWLTRIHEDV